MEFENRPSSTASFLSFLLLKFVHTNNQFTASEGRASLKSFSGDMVGINMSYKNGLYKYTRKCFGRLVCKKRSKNCERMVKGTIVFGFGYLNTVIRYCVQFCTTRVHCSADMQFKIILNILLFQSWINDIVTIKSKKNQIFNSQLMQKYFQ